MNVRPIHYVWKIILLDKREIQTDGEEIAYIMISLQFIVSSVDWKREIYKQTKNIITGDVFIHASVSNLWIIN